MSSPREFMDCRHCNETTGHTRTAGCIIATERAAAVNEGRNMSKDDDKIAAHAMSTSLVKRLRGEAFIPGVHYVSQAEQWMLEAAEQLEQLARGVLTMAANGGMPDTYWLSDSRVSQAAKVLGWTPTEAREWAEQEIDRD